MLLKLGIQHWALKHYQVCSNDDPRLTYHHKGKLKLFMHLYGK